MLSFEVVWFEAYIIVVSREKVDQPEFHLQGEICGKWNKVSYESVFIKWKHKYIKNTRQT